MLSIPELPAAIKARALELGFDACGIAPPSGLPELDVLPEWVARGYAGDMGFLAGSLQLRADARGALPSAKSVIVTATLYNTDRPFSTECADSARAHVARYAWGDDYHKVLLRRLDALIAWMHDVHPAPFEAAPYVDTGPVQERVFAQACGNRVDRQELLRHQSRARVLHLSRRDDLQPAACGRHAGVRPVRHLLAVHRGVPDAGARRARRARCPAMHLVSHDRAAGRSPRRAAARCRHARLRLRRLPGSLSVQCGRALQRRSGVVAAQGLGSAAGGRALATA